MAERSRIPSGKHSKVFTIGKPRSRSMATVCERQSVPESPPRFIDNCDHKVVAVQVNSRNEFFQLVSSWFFVVCLIHY